MNRRAYRGKVDETVAKQLDDILSALEAVQRDLAAVKAAPLPDLNISAALEQRIFSLVQGYATNLIGETAADDQLETLGTGNGTVSQVSISVSGNLSGSVATATTTPNVTLALSANPGFTTVDATTSYKIGGTKVIGARVTGWTAASGTATRSTFDTATVTLPELAQRVKAFLDDLIAHGLIGS